jgi:hypothetical protein
MSEPLGQRGDWELARLSLQEAIETPVVVAASSSTHRRTFLSRDDLLEMVASVEELDGKDDP